MLIFKVFDPVIYPIHLGVAVGMTYDELSSKYIHSEKGEFVEEWRKDYEWNSGNTVSVIDKETNEHLILVLFCGTTDLTMRNIAHESLHVATTIMHHLNMGMGLNVGEDEHVAYLVGWAANCMGKVYEELTKEEEEESNE